MYKRQLVDIDKFELLDCVDTTTEFDASLIDKHVDENALAVTELPKAILIPVEAVQVPFAKTVVVEPSAIPFSYTCIKVPSASADVPETLLTEEVAQIPP